MNARDRIREFRRVPAKDLHANPENWRVHPKAQTSALLGVLAEIGIANAVIAYEPRPGYLELIDGHARVSLAAPEELMPTLILDVTTEEARMLLVTLDPLAAMAETDRGRLAQLIAQADYGDTRVGSLLEAIRRQNRLPGETGLVEPEALPVSEGVPTTKPGDLWRLGAHRVLCGDATQRVDYQRLMGGDGANMVFTDPPYGVAYQADGFAAIANDALPRSELRSFLQRAFAHCAAVLLPNAALYIWHASATRREFETAILGAGLEELQYLIWVKPTLVLGHADYQWQHEPCFYAARAGEHPPFYGPRTETTAWFVAPLQGEPRDAIAIGNGVLLDTGAERIFVGPPPAGGKNYRTVYTEPGDEIALQGDVTTSDVWQIRRDAGKAEHPTAKPVALAARAIANSTMPGQVILDPFLGSGSTLLAAEQLTRRCFGMELDPRYCDLIVRRWESLTGRKAELAQPTTADA